MNVRTAVTKIKNKGLLLVFPLDNRKDIPSLWSEFYPRSKMSWKWDEGGDSRVSDLWFLREKLSTSGQVVYSKWFRGRATLISKDLFTALIKVLNPNLPRVTGLTFNAREILDFLDEDSPISTKQLKRISDLQGREKESTYTRALKELWSRGLIVAYGEVDEGAFPSIAIGSTQVIFEEVWQAAIALDSAQAQKTVDLYLKTNAPFYKFFLSLKKETAQVADSLSDTEGDD